MVCWYAVYTSSRAEKKVKERLEQAGVNCYLPLKTEFRMWSSRRKKVSVPLIPGYIFVWLTPNEYTLNHLHVALAHETNHNVRFQFIKWKNDITLGEMMVSEGLAENFATQMYGEDKAGPWVTKTDMVTLNEYIKPIIHDGLDVQGLENLNAYLYGDEMAALQNYAPVGLPYCAGYACGYHW